MDAVADALAAMCTPEAMEKKYGLEGRGTSAVRGGRRQPLSGNSQAVL